MFFVCLFFTNRQRYGQICSSVTFHYCLNYLQLPCKSERPVLALKMRLFRWVKYSPIFYSNLAALNQGQYTGPITRAYLDPRAEMGPSVAWNSLLIELFCLNCAQMALEGTESDFGLQDWISTLWLKQIFLIFKVSYTETLSTKKERTFAVQCDTGWSWKHSASSA